MTRLLASVMNVEEADCALQGGADIIDLKNPLAGALGALPAPTIQSIVKFVQQRVPTSATVGDLPMQPDILYQAVQQTMCYGVDYVKIGFWGKQISLDCIEILQPLTQQGGKLIAVLFADQQPDLNSLCHFARAGFAGVMLDTANKQAGNLTQHLNQQTLKVFIQKAQILGLINGLAGSIGLAQISQLMLLSPFYLGFRGALCVAQQRQSVLQIGAVKQIREAIHNCKKELKVA
ncbi:(5-formylfuran-3-yl)methyl phosphate synthase [Beggiatoa leptomitoformis]|uniref:(5-formylfuran-3-yl)methyl phosphate synthase n=1 Tax=Beggiatoa leptomitoformis TaxID=288004 RepID=A0A2N9YBQ0_9GAMM|nr:(5-formylfuran-3-yl)methyl phosphate synthase [Beggiatoa leptomitoformis]ALG66744.1 hypothetical protein AL038_02210 [Beggiatoa leptomitoformis]AUI67917.1 hypothetical protein BLE401_03830 [Beggiatoa leptomitoformis]